ncbi:quinone-dependent dihydroorotate dehydrogenase [Taibaiella koreensis]|uniref:quinone-dependent dihydroorotate dehydrogenase n=1 Tax=Taibaiella koreensis TaxID=1268548 RepID=UPI000E59E9AE|nr:quinone-dependent dihydroorotate dehydrogenase [Taibaiella koreensis]
MYALIKFFLFRKDPEVIHYWVMNQLRKWHANAAIRSFLKKNFTLSKPSLERKLWGITFKNPVGLAAGFDKDARFTDELASLGFGFIEIGTLTPLAQDGNDKPRLFRLPKDKALINRMGFNNGGVKAAAERLRQRRSDIIIGGNIGKNKVTANEDATKDYEICFRELYDVVDYFTVNVSSPNTPNLRELQEKEPLQRLLGRLQIINSELGKAKPILLKIAPDLTREQLDDIIDIVHHTGIQGIVATNTTISRAGLQTSGKDVEAMGAGGVSGLPVKDKATDVIRYIHQRSKGAIPIIAAGGVFTARDAQEKLDAGASLVQVYTGFIYEGPRIVRNICEGLA